VDFIAKSMSGLTYYKVEFETMYMDVESNDDLLKIDCVYDDKTYEDAEKAGIQCNSVVMIVRENGGWKFGGFSSLILE